MKTCIITGAGSGIGREVAISLSRTADFTNIALLGRNMKTLSETKSMMESMYKDISLWDINFQEPEKFRL